MTKKKATKKSASGNSKAKASATKPAKKAKRSREVDHGTIDGTNGFHFEGTSEIND